MPLTQRISPKTLVQSLGANLLRADLCLGLEALSFIGDALGGCLDIAEGGKLLKPWERYGRDEDMHLTDATGFEEVTEGEER